MSLIHKAVFVHYHLQPLLHFPPLVTVLARWFCFLVIFYNGDYFSLSFITETTFQV